MEPSERNRGSGNRNKIFVTTLHFHVEVKMRIRPVMMGVNPQINTRFDTTKVVHFKMNVTTVLAHFDVFINERKCLFSVWVQNFK